MGSFNIALFWDILTLCHCTGQPVHTATVAGESPLPWPGHCPAMDSHSDALFHLCRVCGGSINDRNSSTESCCKEIKAIWDISTWKDDPEIHPGAICHKIFRPFAMHRAAGAQGDRNGWAVATLSRCLYRPLHSDGFASRCALLHLCRVCGGLGQLTEMTEIPQLKVAVRR